MTRTARVAPSDAFNEAMIGVASQCQQLERATARRSARDVMYAAQNAASLWLAGRRACRQLMVERPRSPNADAARCQLDRRYVTLLGLFAQAVIVCTSALRTELKRLQELLVKEASKPLVDGEPGRPADGDVTATHPAQPSEGK